MLITELVKRLEELRRVESDIHVVLSDHNGVDVTEEFELDVYTDDRMDRKVMMYPMSPMEKLAVRNREEEELHVDLEPSVQEEALQAMRDIEEREYEEQPVQEERTSRQRRDRST